MKLLHQKYHKIKNQFTLRADSFDNSAKWVKDRGLLDIHRKLSDASKGSLVLEVCCGTGVVGARLLTTASKVAGLDLSLPMLKKARGRLSFCVNGRAEQLPFLDNTFDIVVCRQALHFLDTKNAISEMFRVAKRHSGRIIISQIVPFGRQDSKWLYRIHRKKQPLLNNFLSEQDLKDLLKNSGFVDIVSCEHCIEEPVNNWLKDTFLPQPKIEAIKKMFLNAPAAYKAAHHTKVIDGDIFDMMRWVALRGKKP